MDLEILLEKLWSRLESPSERERSALFVEDSEPRMEEIPGPVISTLGQVLARTDDPPHILVSTKGTIMA